MVHYRELSEQQTLFRESLCCVVDLLSPPGDCEHTRARLR